MQVRGGVIMYILLRGLVKAATMVDGEKNFGI